MRRDNYRRTRPPKPRKMRSGRQQWDEVTGFLAYEYDLAEDAYGNLVDTRHPENFDNPDTYPDAGREP
jgi:hypothetical protein